MTSNPMLSPKATENVMLDSAPMTISGTANKTLLLLGAVVLSACATWSICAGGFHDKAMLLATIGLIAGFILALITIFKPQQAKLTAPIYAICEGLAVGAISFYYNAAFEGIVLNAVIITFLALATMLVLYKTGTIKATPLFRKTIITATCAIAIFYLVAWLGSLFGHPMQAYENSTAGIVISLVICVVAALNFILDFDFVEQGERNGLPDYFEWYGAFALLVTVIWLYLEILRLLAKYSSRRR